MILRAILKVVLPSLVVVVVAVVTVLQNELNDNRGEGVSPSGTFIHQNIKDQHVFSS